MAMQEAMSDEERRLRLACATDFVDAYSRLLKIRTKLGGISPLTLNATQRSLHSQIEEQRARTGRVRKVVLKGRQQGVTTYGGGRHYWRVTHRRGVRAYIISHTDKSTATLYRMVRRFHDSMPELLRPSTGAANANELIFPGLDSGYGIATAGGREIGRGDTIQYVHGSEVAFWPNATSHIAGILQAVPEVGDTEIVLESTAYGLGGAFHEIWVGAERGEVDFEPVFLPWFMHEEYEEEAPEKWEPPLEWLDYGRAHGLRRGQTYWAWKKSRGMSRGTVSDKPYWQFRQEYPATASEAFQTAGEAPFIKPELVAHARRRKEIATGPLIIGVDPAQGGRDGTGVIDRQGRRAGERICERWRDENAMTIVGKIARLIRAYSPARVNIDVGGGGKEIYDRLCELGYGTIVEVVNFGGAAVGSGPVDPDRYVNRRSEMWDTMRHWFEEPAGVQVPDLDALQADVCAPAWGRGATRYDSSQRLQLEPKDHIVERLKFSPDIGDALALTFASPVWADEDEDEDRYTRRDDGRSSITGY